MNLEFREQVWKRSSNPRRNPPRSRKVRTAYGLQYRYEAARLLIGRSLAEPAPPDPLPSGTKYHPRAIPAKNLFGNDDDLWMSALILDGRLGLDATVVQFRAFTEAHWARGFQHVREALSAAAAMNSNWSNGWPNGCRRTAQRSTFPLPHRAAWPGRFASRSAPPAARIRRQAGGLCHQWAGRAAAPRADRPIGRGKTTTG